MTYLIIWLYLNTYRRFLSFIINQYYHWFRLHKNKTLVDSELKRLKENIKTFDDIIQESKSFTWKSDPLGGAIDWSPNIESFLINAKKDDCDGAAMYTAYLADLAELS